MPRGRKESDYTARDLVQFTWPETAGWECSCSVSELFWMGYFRANKTCKVFRECSALGRKIHNHLMPQNRLAPELNQKLLCGCTQHGAQTNKISWKLKNYAERLSQESHRCWPDLSQAVKSDLMHAACIVNNIRAARRSVIQITFNTTAHGKYKFTHTELFCSSSPHAWPTKGNWSPALLSSTQHTISVSPRVHTSPLYETTTPVQHNIPSQGKNVHLYVSWNMP